ncbi:hypothetical protein BM536_038315 [Streptomyces phaeoluteigriseus]|uniref:Uncharacterized protein n=1 Tax=Streptomyces phaeoluteigriseus TaxID=114686 RepID=A0A1V6MHG7_9ACTN|nr:hypothetical protein [Streptomyces phaeoluteigriseus]OQD51753.1 hypothetical protein BM536_038315 [Streptomyces phaeoluteigriseus]
MTHEAEQQRTPRELSEDEEATALADRMGEDADPDDDPPLGVVKGPYQPSDRHPHPLAPRVPPAPPAE